MKIKPLSIVAAAIAIYTALAGPALALDPQESETSISFTEYTDNTKPKDPDDPNTDSGADGTEQPGPLSLDYVTDFAFGNRPITASSQLYDTSTTKPYVQVTDLRGTGAGWRLTAALSKFTSGGVDTLSGASLILSNGSAISSYDTAAPAPSSKTTLTSDGTVADVVTASNASGGQGRGTWLVRWYPTGGASDVQLSVPAASASTGTHTATIVWTLYDAP